MNEQSPESAEQQPGVLREKIENKHHVLDIRWVDGTENTVYFPVAGVPLYDLETHKYLDLMPGKEAVDLHWAHAPHMTSEEFSLVKLWKESHGKK